MSYWPFSNVDLCPETFESLKTLVGIGIWGVFHPAKWAIGQIVVNQFGGYCSVGGGNLNGKDMSKIDRSAAYMCRYLAKNIVAAGISDTAKVELSYMIGVPQPSSINIELNRNQDRTDDIIQWIKGHVDLNPSGIIKRFEGGFPRYYNTALHGHYGKTDEEMKDKQTAGLYPWEKTDLTESLFHFLNTKK